MQPSPTQVLRALFRSPDVRSLGVCGGTLRTARRWRKSCVRVSEPRLRRVLGGFLKSGSCTGEGSLCLGTVCAGAGALRCPLRRGQQPLLFKEKPFSVWSWAGSDVLMARVFQPGVRGVPPHRSAARGQPGVAAAAGVPCADEFSRSVLGPSSLGPRGSWGRQQLRGSRLSPAAEGRVHAAPPACPPWQDGAARWRPAPGLAAPCARGCCSAPARWQPRVSTLSSSPPSGAEDLGRPPLAVLGLSGLWGHGTQAGLLSLWLGRGLVEPWRPGLLLLFAVILPVLPGWARGAARAPGRVLGAWPYPLRAGGSLQQRLCWKGRRPLRTLPTVLPSPALGSVPEGPPVQEEQCAPAAVSTRRRLLLAPPRDAVAAAVW